jgi:orotidine-5'-phosphate decarboxylase
LITFMNPPIKLIVALDFDSASKALALVDQLDPTQCALKVGSEMFTLLGMDFVRMLVTRQFNVFLDLKFYDIPNTVARACAVAADNGIWMLTLHATGGLQMMQAARKTMELYGANRPLLVAVTILTSMFAGDLPAIGISDTLQEHVCVLAKLAQESGCDGVVSSALEVPMIKAACGTDFLTVSPGIRRNGDTLDDQARIVTPQMAISAGSDYLVVGRPITRALNPAIALREFLIAML